MKYLNTRYSMLLRIIDLGSTVIVLVMFQTLDFSGSPLNIYGRNDTMSKICFKTTEGVVGCERVQMKQDWL